MFIEYKMINNIEYAMLVSSVRIDGKVKKGKRINLGRVIDKQKSIYKNRERGLFTYNKETDQYGNVDPEFKEPPELKRKTKIRRREILDIEFGSVYLLDKFLEQEQIWKLVDAIGFKNRDSIRALLAYYCISRYSNRQASFWWEYSYARILYPNAQLASQRISEMLEDLGSEEAKHLFFKAYYDFLKKQKSQSVNFDTVNSQESDENQSKTDDMIENGILIDSTGLPNACNLPITAISNHNGKISEEIRLIYVVQQETGLPLFFRYIAGNIIDASTVKTTIAELKANGVDTNFAILDAGYYNGKNADVLIDAKISFITRMHSNFCIYKDCVNKYRNELETEENLVIYNGRMVYIKCCDCNIGEKSNRKAYAYLCLDCTMKREEEFHLSQRLEDKTDVSIAEIHKSRNSLGLFMLVSTRKIAKENLLPIYYTRNHIEDIFKLCKGDCKILPLNIRKEETFKGHLLITFIATVVMKLIFKKLKNYKITLENLFMILDQHRCKIYDETIIVDECSKLMNHIYKTVFNISCPTEIEYHAPKNLNDIIKEIGSDMITSGAN